MRKEDVMPRSPLPRLVMFLVRHAVIGFGVAAVFVATLVAFDVARLGSIMSASSDRLLALSVLTFALGLTFGSVQMAFAVMLMPGRDDDRQGGRRIKAQLQPARVVVRRPR